MRVRLGHVARELSRSAADVTQGLVYLETPEAMSAQDGRKATWGESAGQVGTGAAWPGHVRLARPRGGLDQGPCDGVSFGSWWRMSHQRTRRLLWGAMVLLSVGACAGGQRQSTLIRQQDSVMASTAELRFEVVELARAVTGEIEAGADGVREVSTDPDVRREALLWKVNAIPQVQTAALQFDPFVAGMDLWTFLAQMRNFFASGEGAVAFGEHAHIAQEAMARAERRLQETLGRVSEVSGEHQHEGVEEWAETHPITGFDFRREPITTKYAESLRGRGGSTLAALYEVQSSMARLELRAALLSETLPKQVRWNAELAAGDMGRVAEMEGVLSNLNHTLVSTGELAERTPEMLAAERAAVMQGIREESAAALGFIERERELAFDALTRERQAAMKDVSEMVDRQRVAAVSDIDALVERRARGVIDFALLRLGQILAAVALVGLAIFAFLRLGRAGEGKSGRPGRLGERWSASHHPGRRESDRAPA